MTEHKSVMADNLTSTSSHDDVTLPDVTKDLKMANSQMGDLKEFEKLDLLLSHIPKKAQHGLLKSCDLVLTCIDANSLYIVLGTNVGITFLWSRRDNSMQRLKSASNSDVITSVRLHHGIDDQLALATAAGDLSVYFIPGVASIQRRQVQKVDVKDMHHHYVTCLEWSTNGMKLYSADKSGMVVSTEVDFDKGQCRSSVLLVEPSTEIVQLDYKHKILLVSTRLRSFIVRIDLKCQVVTIGTKDRKIPGPFGACFIPELCKTDDAKLYAARPGRRLWLSDVQGVVMNTHIFSEPLSAQVPEIPLLSVGKLQIGHTDFQFGVLKYFRGREVVTWSNHALVVVDPQANRVVGRQGRLNGIVDVAVVGETGEIFLLRRHAEARVIRIAATAEPKVIRAEILPVTIGEKLEKEKENSAQQLFKKFTKHLEKSILSDSNPQSGMSDRNPQSGVTEPVRPGTDTSPGLPPVVRLASPELDGVRMFTGETPASHPSSTPEPEPCLPEPTLAPTISPTPGVTVLITPSLPVTQIKTVNESPPVVEGQQVKFENVSVNPNPGENIVFSHRMKKHKKKKTKEGLQLPRGKDDDSVSVASVSSQLSDESTVSAATSNSTPTSAIVAAATSNSTPTSAIVAAATSDSTPTSVTIAAATTNNTPASASVLNALHNADEMLKLVDILLNTNGEQVPPPGVAGRMADNTESSVSGVTILPEDVHIPATSTKTAVTAAIDTSHHSVDNKEVSPITLDMKVHANLSDQHDVLVSGDLSGQNSLGVVSVLSCDASEKSKNQSRNFLSECDQHLEVSRDVKEVAKDECDQPKHVPDVSAIVENAIANLDRSRAVTAALESQESHTSRSRRSPSSQTSFQDVYSEIDVIESSDPFHKGYKRDNSGDDFYSLFLDTLPESPASPVGKPPLLSLQQTVIFPSEAERSMEMQDVAERWLANTWSEFTTPANIYSLAMSNSHVWFTDKSENICYSSINTPKGIQWRKASGQANQISVSPSGHIVWRLHRGVVYAGTKINARHPEGLKWVEAVKEVATISVDNDCAWFVMQNGDVMMQRRLSQERPCYKSQKVECHHRLKHIITRYGVVWAVTENLGLLVRTGVSVEAPEGNEWELVHREVPPYLFSHVALDNENIGWAIDVLGQVWFCDGVTRSQPLGRRIWWQVPLSEYIFHDATTLDMIKGFARKFDPTKLSHILSTSRGGMVVAGSLGVLLAMDFRNILQVCRGNVQGYHWLEAQPAQMSPSSTWRQVCAQVSHLDWGLLWAQHTNGDVFTFKQARAEASVVKDCPDICCLAVGPTTTWALSSNGAIYVRTGVGPHCPQGTGWVELDITQLGDAHIVHISCNALYVWAVEACGTVYQRIGAKPPSENNLSPAWLAIDTFAVIVFTKVFSGPLDWMVWAIDNSRLPYVRAGITENMPIGQEWVNVPGIQAVDLALTKTGVWALTPSGEIFFRYGIARNMPCGNYWKKIPGTFIKISASANDELWGINTDGQLMQCSIKHLSRHQDSVDPFVLPEPTTNSSAVPEDVDWEIV